MISRSALMGSKQDLPLTANLTTSLELAAHPLREVPVMVLGCQRQTDQVASASLVFDPVTSTDEHAAIRATTGTPDFAFVPISLSTYQHIIGKKIVAPLDFELSSTPADFAHGLSQRPVIVLGVMIHGDVQNASVLTFDPVYTDHRTMRIGHTSAVGTATWRVLPITQTRYNEIIGKAVPVIAISNLTTADQNIVHHLSRRPHTVAGCQIVGDVSDGAELAYDQPLSTNVLMRLATVGGAGPSWRVLPIGAAHVGV